MIFSELFQCLKGKHKIRRKRVPIYYTRIRIKIPYTGSCEDHKHLTSVRNEIHFSPRDD